MKKGILTLLFLSPMIASATEDLRKMAEQYRQSAVIYKFSTLCPTNAAHCQQPSRAIDAALKTVRETIKVEREHLIAEKSTFEKMRLDAEKRPAGRLRERAIDYASQWHKTQQAIIRQTATGILDQASEVILAEALKLHLLARHPVVVRHKFFHSSNNAQLRVEVWGRYFEEIETEREPKVHIQLSVLDTNIYSYISTCSADQRKEMSRKYRRGGGDVTLEFEIIKYDTEASRDQGVTFESLNVELRDNTRVYFHHGEGCFD